MRKTLEIKSHILSYSEKKKVLIKQINNRVKGMSSNFKSSNKLNLSLAKSYG